MRALVETSKKPNLKIDLTNYNSFPTPYEEITNSEFITLFKWTKFDFEEDREIIIDKQFYRTRLWYNNEYGLAVMFPSNCSYKKTNDYGYHTVYDLTDGSFYYIGCKHKWDETTVSNCYHKWTCTKCGFGKMVDSGD